jgi:flavin-dependent dehydrogenase
MHDVVIVGGSIAGASAAIELAQRGYDVLVIERAAGHRRKACGEGIFPGGVRALAELGVLEKVRAHACELRSLRFIAGPHHAAAPLGHNGSHGLGIMRSVLDPALLATAEHAGANVRRGVICRGLARSADGWFALRTDSGLLSGRVIVAADGLRSRLRREAGLDRPVRGRRYGISAHVRLAASNPSSVDVYIERGRELYVTPVSDGVANVALLLGAGAMRAFAGHPEAAFRQMIAPHPSLAGAELLDAPVAAGPFPAACSRAWRANLLLAGDAAGFFDGISGEGISSALISSRACARAVDLFLRTGDVSALQRYDAERRALVRNSDMLARLSLALAARPALARLAVQHLARQPATFARMVAINTGELPLRALRPRDIAALAFGL